MQRKFLTAPCTVEFYRQTRIAAATLDMSIAEFVRQAVEKSKQEILADDKKIVTGVQRETA